MRIAAYLEETGETLTEFANRLGAKVTTLHGYVSLRRIPNALMVARIEAATGGKVRAVDLVPETEAKAERAA